MSEVMQIEAIGTGWSGLRRTRTRHAAGLLAVLTLWSGGAWAEDLPKLSGAQIRARFSDRQFTDEVHWREVYQSDGTFRSYSMGKVRTGKWFIRSNDLCLDLPEPDGGCFEVTSSGSRVVMTPKGTGLTSVGVLEPISDRK
ncbi:hypothetical protein ACFFWD_08150 [Bradyrhizobium erythrophlei]|uniref:hypothetical protein n=1 Tax=Bradyrhizobium erythrophlei TaxID=1437360 RepID=UPI0035EEF85B